MERILIGSIQLNTSKSGKPLADLYSTDTRLQYPVLRLFDLSALIDVGIDPQDLGPDRHHCRFWAHYTESDKTNGRGNPYKDILHLEPLDLPAAGNGDTAAPELLAELRADLLQDLQAVLQPELRDIRLCLESISRILQARLDTNPSPSLGPDPDPDTDIGCQSDSSGPGPAPGPAYTNGDPVSDNPAELDAYNLHFSHTNQTPQSVDHLRQWVCARGT